MREKTRCFTGHRQIPPEEQAGIMSGDNVFEKRGIRRDTTGDAEKTRYFQGKRPLFSRDTAGGSHFLCPGRTASVASPFSRPPAAQDGPGRRRRPRATQDTRARKNPGERLKTGISGAFLPMARTGGRSAPPRKSQQQTQESGASRPVRIV